MITDKLNNLIREQKRKNTLYVVKKILKKRKDFKILLFASSYGFFTDMVQRPNHLFKFFAQNNYLIFWPDENVAKVIEADTNTYLFPMKDLKKFIRCKKYNKTIMTISTHYTYKNLENDLLYAHKNNDKIILEHIDDIMLIMDLKKRKELYDRFNKLCKNEDIIVTVSADKLYEQASEMRGSKNNILIVKNGVNPQDFAISYYNNVPPNIKPLIDKHKPIIGYYGMIHNAWFDFALIEEVVEKNPDFEFLFIGPHNENDMTKLNNFDNWTCLDRIHYNDIPNYARFFSAACMPFMDNEITKGTSPVKLFEYMALKLPIISTPINEAYNYKSCLIAHDATEFSEYLTKIDFLRSDKNYLNILEKEMLENTWAERVDVIINKIDEN